jgi:hypothetical protein
MKSVLVVGTVSNVEESMGKDLRKLLDSLTRFQRISIFLVESDSSDKTLELLNKFKREVPYFDFVSQGKLKQSLPDRVERIRFCRNLYVSHIRSLSEQYLPEFTIVVDLDGMNSAITANGIASCFALNTWDVVLSNQTGGYYDIFALRHPIWQAGNCMDELQQYRLKIPALRIGKFNWLKRLGQIWDYDKARYLAIYSKMIRINKDAPWIKVNSGFGGLAIYKTELFLSYDYTNLGAHQNESEHVTLHRKIVENKRNIFINPAFINSRWNTYNVNRYFVVRQIRRMIWDSRWFYTSIKKITGKL